MRYTEPPAGVERERWRQEHDEWVARSDERRRQRARMAAARRAGKQRRHAERLRLLLERGA